MYTTEQIIHGIARYVDGDVLANLPTSGKWIVGTYSTLMIRNAEELMRRMYSNEFVNMAGITDDAGQIDVDTLALHLKNAATKYGALQLNVPFVGLLTFTEHDIDRVHKYIRGEL